MNASVFGPAERFRATLGIHRCSFGRNSREGDPGSMHLPASRFRRWFAFADSRDGRKCILIFSGKAQFGIDCVPGASNNNTALEAGKIV